MSFRNRSTQNEVLAEIEPIGNVLKIGPDLRFPRIAFGPFPVAIKLLVEAVAIYPAFSIGAGSRIPVPVPGTSYAVCLVNDFVRSASDRSEACEASPIRKSLRPGSRHQAPLPGFLRSMFLSRRVPPLLSKSLWNTRRLTVRCMSPAGLSLAYPLLVRAHAHAHQ